MVLGIWPRVSAPVEETMVSSSIVTLGIEDDSEPVAMTTCFAVWIS